MLDKHRLCVFHLCFMQWLNPDTIAAGSILISLLPEHRTSIVNTIAGRVLCMYRDRIFSIERSPAHFLFQCSGTLNQYVWMCVSKYVVLHCLCSSLFTGWFRFSVFCVFDVHKLWLFAVSHGHYPCQYSVISTTKHLCPCTHVHTAGNVCICSGMQ